MVLRLLGIEEEEELRKEWGPCRAGSSPEPRVKNGSVPAGPARESLWLNGSGLELGGG